jgi:hypothetical protein
MQVHELPQQAGAAMKVLDDSVDDTTVAFYRCADEKRAARAPWPRQPVVSHSRSRVRSIKGFLVHFKSDKDTVADGFGASWVLGARPALCACANTRLTGVCTERAGEVTPEEVKINALVKENHAASTTAGYATDGSLVVRRQARFSVAVDPVRVVPSRWRFSLLAVRRREEARPREPSDRWARSEPQGRTDGHRH